MSYGNHDRTEASELFRPKDSDNANRIFDTRGSSGNNPEKLARILASWDLFINIMGWNTKDKNGNNDKPLANLTGFLAQYQGSVDTAYHNDYKDIQIAQEVVRRQTERKGISILQQ